MLPARSSRLSSVEAVGGDNQRRFAPVARRRGVTNRRSEQFGVVGWGEVARGRSRSRNVTLPARSGRLVSVAAVRSEQRRSERFGVAEQAAGLLTRSELRDVLQELLSLHGRVNFGIDARDAMIGGDQEGDACVIAGSGRHTERAGPGAVFIGDERKREAVLLGKARVGLDVVARDADDGDACCVKLVPCVSYGASLLGATWRSVFWIEVDSGIGVARGG